MSRNCCSSSSLCPGAGAVFPVIPKHVISCASTADLAFLAISFCVHHLLSIALLPGIPIFSSFQVVLPLVIFFSGTSYGLWMVVQLHHILLSVASIRVHCASPFVNLSIHISRRAILSLWFWPHGWIAMACTALGRAGSTTYIVYTRRPVTRSQGTGTEDPVTETSTPEGDALLNRVKARTFGAPSYKPITLNRETRTPHSG